MSVFSPDSCLMFRIGCFPYMKLRKDRLHAAIHIQIYAEAGFSNDITHHLYDD